MKTIWKYEIPIEDEFTITMPLGSQPLSVAVQDGQPVMWVAIIDSKEKKQEQHRFLLRGTGQPFPEMIWHKFIGTFQLPELGLVYHLFDDLT